jgi:hypothetical protein
MTMVSKYSVATARSRINDILLAKDDGSEEDGSDMEDDL